MHPLAISSLCMLLLLLHTAHLWRCVAAHGRLLEPPARNTLWRFGYKAPANYNDNELFCGGIGGITRNEGKCGVCGDPYDGPRVHETGNSMALNVTARNFFPGSSIEILIEVVANHGGTFEFEMCWRDNATVRETEECFEPLKLNTPVNPLPSPASKSQSNHVHKPSEKLLQPNEEELERAAEDDLRDEYEFVLDPDAGTGLYAMSVMLPVERTCDHCVLRWHWRSANNWGVCDDGSEAIGCGYQEVYRNCADVSVSRNGAGIGLGLQRRRRRRRRR